MKAILYRLILSALFCMLLTSCAKGGFMDYLSVFGLS